MIHAVALVAQSRQHRALLCSTSDACKDLHVPACSADGSPQRSPARLSAPGRPRLWSAREPASMGGACVTLAARSSSLCHVKRLPKMHSSPPDSSHSRVHAAAAHFLHVRVLKHRIENVLPSKSILRAADHVRRLPLLTGLLGVAVRSWTTGEGLMSSGMAAQP